MAAKRLFMMESCLCSGDGLSPDSAFRIGDPAIMDVILCLLGVSESIRDVRNDDILSVITLTENPYGIANLFFVSI